MVRFEEARDIDGVRETNELAFGTPLEARLVDALRGADHSLSLVATMDDRVVGHILFTPVNLEPANDARVAGLGPMAVRPAHQRAGIGGQLIRAGLDACRRHGYAAVVVVGHPEYYPRFGFVRADTWRLTCEFPVPPEAFMVCALEEDAGNRVSGLVRYLPEFANV